MMQPSSNINGEFAQNICDKQYAYVFVVHHVLLFSNT